MTLFPNKNKKNGVMNGNYCRILPKARIASCQRMRKNAFSISILTKLNSILTQDMANACYNILRLPKL